MPRRALLCLSPLALELGGIQVAHALLGLVAVQLAVLRAAMLRDESKPKY